MRFAALVALTAPNCLPPCSLWARLLRQQYNQECSLKECAVPVCFDIHVLYLPLPSPTPCRGHVVWQAPPPGAGVVALMALNVLTAHQAAQQSEGHQAAQQSEGQQVSRAPDKVSRGPDTLTDSSQAGQSSLSADELHSLVEACRLAFADALEWVADPVAHELPLAELSCARRAAARYQAHYSPHKVWVRPAGWRPAWAVQAVQAVQGGAATHMCHAWHA